MRPTKTLQQLLAVLPLIVISLLAACSRADNAPQQPEIDVPAIILDADICSSTDDLFALEMLYHYANQQKCTLLGVVVDREGEDNAAFADVMNTYFGYGNVPIGLVRHGVSQPQVWIDYAHIAHLKDAQERPLFQRTVSDYSTLPDGWQLYRQLLAQQKDHSVSIISTGFVTSLSQLLQSPADEYSPLNGVELVRRKVKCIYMQGGVFGDSEEPDFNFQQASAFSHEFFRLWPQDVDMVFSPMEVGQAVNYLPEQVISDISWTDIHPIKLVYEKCNCDTGQRMWDVMPVIQAVEGDGQFLLSERGTVTLTPEYSTLFTPSSTGNCRYQKAGDDTWAAQILGKLREINKRRDS